MATVSDLDAVVRRVKEAHRLISAHRCRCGWEGDDAITHVIDSLHLEPYYYGNSPTNAFVVLGQNGVGSDDNGS